MFIHTTACSHFSEDKRDRPTLNTAIRTTEFLCGYTCLQARAAYSDQPLPVCAPVSLLRRVRSGIVNLAFRFFSYAMRRKGWGNLLTIGKIEGEKQQDDKEGNIQIVCIRAGQRISLRWSWLRRLKSDDSGEAWSLTSFTLCNLRRFHPFRWML